MATGASRIVPDAGRLALPVYAVYATDADPRGVGPALDGPRAVVVEEALTQFG